MTAEGDTEVLVDKRPKTLLEKYEIPIQHLDFEYIKNCNNIKEIEKIVKILRSKDEGYYPELLKCAEEKLKSLNCNHRLLRVDAPIMTKEALSKDEWKSITDDLEDWKGKVSSKEMVLSNAPKCNIKAYPDIRKSTMGLPNETKNVEAKKPQRIKGFDYASWDKFDADTECYKMDLEEKQREAEREKKALEAKKKPVQIEKTIEEKALEEIKGSVEHMTKEEREVLAFKEKTIGNEFFKTNSWSDAVKHYTKCIYIHPTCTGYNNRAAAYLKQFKFNQALDDLNNALKLNPKDIKALYRRAITLQHKNRYAEALEDIDELLKINPSHVVGRHLGDQLRENCSAIPKKHKFKIHDKDNPDDYRVKDATMEEMKDCKTANYVEVNEWGLPKIMCNCNGKYTHEPGIRHENHVRFQQSYKKYPRASSSVTEIKPQEKKPDPLTFTIKEELERIDEEFNGKSAKKIVELNQIDEESSGKSTNAKKIEIVELKKIDESIGKNKNTKKIDIVEFKKDDESKRKIEKKIEPELEKIEEEKSEECPKKIFESSTRSCLVIDKRIEKRNSKLEKSNIPQIENKIHSKNHKTAQNIDIQDSNETNLSKCWCKEDENLAVYEIMNLWKSKDSFKHQANLLRSICPSHLSKVIGSNIDNTMISNLFNCLYHQFDHKTEIDTIRSYCRAISKLNRYKIMLCFIDENDKTIMEKLQQITGPFLENSEQ